MCWILRQKMSILKMWIVPYVRRCFFGISLFLGGLLKHIRWNNATFSDCPHRGVVTVIQKANIHMNAYELIFGCLVSSVTQLPCLSADLHHHDNIRLKSSILCRQVMSHVSMWWWAEWTKSGGQNKEKKYTRIKKQKHTHKKKNQKRNDKVCLWNPTSTQGPIRKETSNKKRCLFGVCKGQIIKINQRNW